MPDTLDTVMREIDDDHARSLHRTRELATSYHQHLVAGGDPYRHDACGWRDSLAPKYRVAIQRMVEAQLGQVPRPFAPSEVNQSLYVVICRLHDRLGEWVTLDDLWGGTRGRSQMESQSMLGTFRDGNYRRMAGTGYRVEKDKVGGKVAYRMTRSEEAAA
jgi:hypothetical protein